MPEYVTAAALAALIGAAGDDERVILATAAANELVERWVPQAPVDVDPLARADVPYLPSSPDVGPAELAGAPRARYGRWDTRLRWRWLGQTVEPGPPAPVTATTRQAGLELAHELYRAHAAVGGVFEVGDLLARLPADRVRPIRDLLDADTHAWGIG